MSAQRALRAARVRMSARCPLPCVRAAGRGRVCIAACLASGAAAPAQECCSAGTGLGGQSSASDSCQCWLLETLPTEHPKPSWDRKWPV